MMRQITHAGAPFPTIDAALDAGELFVRRQSHASFVGAAAEEQHGGYFVRVAWSTPSAGSRHRRNHRHQHVAEIGRITPHERLGFDVGELCRRDGCTGRIGSKFDDRVSCPVCLWEGGI